MGEKSTRALGRIGEEAAAKTLKEKGYMILKSNYRCPWGEIDIVASKDGKLSFIEVKTRSSSRYGRPCEAVDRNKQRHIKNTALYYLKENAAEGIYYPHITFDVIEVTVNHIKNAF